MIMVSKHIQMKIADKITTLLFYLSILLFIIGFNFSHNPAGNWYQQFLPNLNSRQITDITFTDSLNGYAIVNRITLQDTSFILRTTNGGDNWFFVYADSGVTYNRIQFINKNTGFVGGRINKFNIFRMVKTTNAGSNWFYINAPFDVTANDMHVLSEDTIWLADASAPTGGVFRTTNGGASWQQQLFLGNSNPNHVYFYNGRLGFICEDNIYLRRTNDGGASWSVVTGAGGFLDMYFADSLTGWKTSFQKTTDGGLNWVNQVIPSGGIIQSNSISNFSNINKDTIWANGGFVLFPNNQARSILNRTTNGGQNWLFQIPDTSKIDNIVYYYTNFVNKNYGWATDNMPIRGEIHTTNGGDTTFYVPVHQISSEVPKEFKLFQNYPNPFNSMTKLKFQMSKGGNAIIKLFDVTGKEISFILNEKLNIGVYEISFDANNYSSGVYFYSLIVDGKLIDTKKMLLVK